MELRGLQSLLFVKTMEWTDIYRVAGSEKVRDLEFELNKELEELKNELEENTLIHGIPSKPIRYFFFFNCPLNLLMTITSHISLK